MIYNLALELSNDYSFLNIFKYLTFRAGASFATAMLICFLIGPYIINLLKKRQKKGQPIRLDGPEWQISANRGTPTMGGSMILISMTISTLLWTDLFNIYIWLLLCLTLSFGFIGFIDDYLKLSRFSHKGLSGKLQLFLQFIFSFLFSILLCSYSNQDYTFITFPVFKELIINIGYFWFIFSMFVIVGSSNAVNLTDGLDGLATVPVMLVALSFTLISYLVGNIIFSDYLDIQFIPGAGEVAICC